ncbi:PREDICTED: mediator of RNA polymerase II transcription subunit 15-like [Rhagoletis zephyria]|uniref:mediator of RNA polymerase II transcription subunit 15-like n=1 Tax=Rhagoletis zephyria TaxID=28612 RepID=UPI0008119016|nr:PREDICTED: mediator of RNA polymerase II transcription subunit 15-like [Rhagoletis zephyria]
MRLSTSNDSKPDNYQINAKICRLVERHPCMYDRSHPHYLKKDVVDKAWVKISKEMDDSIPSCKERWRNIRTSFARSINVNKVPSSANRTKPYYLHEELQFLARHITPGIPVSRRPNYYTSADEKSEMIEVPIGEESFDGFAAMAAQEEEEDDEQRTDEDESQQERAPSSSVDEATMSGKGEQASQSQSAQEAQADGGENTLPAQNSPLPLVQHQQPLQSQQQTQSVPTQLQQQQQPQQQQQQQQQLPLPLPLPLPPALPVEPMEVVERIVAEVPVPVMPLYPFKKRLRPAETMMCAEVEPERDIKPQPSELCTPDPDFDAAFLQGLLPEMKAMDFRQKIIFKKRIYEVIGEIFENTTASCSSARRSSQANNSYNGHVSNASSNGTAFSNGYVANATAAYTNGYIPNNKGRTPPPTPTPTPTSSPSASGYASPLNTLNSSSPTINAADLAMIRRLSTLLQSPAVASSTSAMTALPKNVASISSTVRTTTNTTSAASSMSPASTLNAHRGAFTRSSANLLRNNSAPTSSTNYGSASSTPAAISHAVKQELLDD